MFILIQKLKFSKSNYLDFKYEFLIEKDFREVVKIRGEWLYYSIFILKDNIVFGVLFR